MKRVIRANRYQEKSDRHMQYIAFVGEKLAQIARTDSEEELNQLASDIGFKFSHATSKEDLMERVLEELEWYIKEYKEQRAKSNALPKVKEDLITFIDSALGYDLYKTKGEWSKDAYRIEHSDGSEPTHKEMNDICKAIIEPFDAKFDEGLGGSWTSHSGHIRGVDFRIGFNRDYDLDPQGKEFSLQLQF